MIISKEYREQNRLLHETNAGYGTSGARWAKYVQDLITHEGCSTVLDWGCGKGTLGGELRKRGIEITEFDPCVPGLDAEPEPADLVTCTDVLEHIEPRHINAVIRALRKVTRRKLFFNIATRPAGKTLPDGRNAHLLVKPAAWWREKLLREFDVIWWGGGAKEIHGEAVPKGRLRLTADKPRQRRPLTMAWVQQFEHIRSQINKYADPIGRVQSIRMWEGVDDELADVQVVCNIIENLADADAALADVTKYALKAIFATVKLDDARGEFYWRRLFEKRCRIAQCHVEQGHALIFASPAIHVQGINAVGAVDSAKRWEQVKAAIARFPKRIYTATAHDRRAILACYGPSLAQTIPLMKREQVETGAVVVSVSGAHDYLLSQGIVPDYHVECDPRPHKADNIERVVPQVQYLLASVVHPVLFDKLGPDADVRLWHISSEDHTMRLVDEMGEKPEHIISGGGSVGLRSIPLLYALGYRDLSIYGMDCSFADGGQQQWAGKHAGKRQDVIEVEVAGRVFATSPILLTYAMNFWETAQKAPGLGFRLFGDGYLQTTARAIGFKPQALVRQTEKAA